VNNYLLISLLFLALTFALFAQEREIVTVERVIDGDTIVLTDGTRIRLIGVDTPETKHPKKPVEFFGPEASAFTTEMLDDQRILLIFDSTKTYDRYGRLLTYIHTLDQDTTDFCLKLIKLGYGRAYTKHPHSRLVEYTRADSIAHAQSLGLWSNPKLSK